MRRNREGEGSLVEQEKERCAGEGNLEEGWKETVEGEGSPEQERRGGREREPERGRGTSTGRGEMEGGARGGGGAAGGAGPRRRQRGSGGGGRLVVPHSASSLSPLSLHPASLARWRRWGLGSPRIRSRARSPGCPAAWVALGSLRPEQFCEPGPLEPRRRPAGAGSRRGLRMDSACQAPHTPVRVNTPVPKRTWKGASSTVSKF